MKDYSEMLTPDQAARITGTQRGALYSAIRCGKMKAEKMCGRKRWRIDVKEVLRYINDRYDRNGTKIGKELVIDPEKGEMSVKQAAELLKLRYAQVYFHIRAGLIPHKRKAWAVVLNREDVEKYRRLINADRQFSKV